MLVSVQLGRPRLHRFTARGGFDAGGTLLGGQAFLWRRHPQEAATFDGVALGHAWRVTVRGARLEVETTLPAPAARRYLGLEPDYGRAVARLREDPALAEAVRRHRGLRVLRQDPWEALAAFLVSANNNVLRIEGILRRLAAAVGPAVEAPRGGKVAAMPSPAAVAELDEDDLRRLGLGYRAPLLRRTAQAVAEGFPLARLRRRPYGEAHAELCTLPGVGPKVADCVLLFGLGHSEAFPVDRWIARAMEDVLGEDLPPARVGDAARERWGEDAGLAQQFLFHAARMRAARGPGGARAEKGKRGSPLAPAWSSRTSSSR